MQGAPGARSRSGTGWAQVVLRKAHNSADIEAEVRAAIDEFARRGFRALGLAVAEGAAGEARWDADPATLVRLYPLAFIP